MIPLLLLLSFFFQGTLFSYLPLLPSLYLFGSLLVLIHREIFGQDTPGANDNAAGVATLLKVGEEIGIDRPKYTEIYLVATGSEESGTVGMIHLLESWKERLAGCYVINLDNLGTGQLKYTTGEGMLKVYPSSKELVSYLKEIIRQEGYHLVPTVNSFMTTDAVPAMVRGYPSISLRAEDKDGLLPNWHWPTDTWEKVEEENLHLAVKVVMSLIKKIDDESKLV